tara:strand:+ start:1330 stop:1461 length:132 start_codon:yes stop_codon:yes gene_type:complete
MAKSKKHLLKELRKGYLSQITPGKMKVIEKSPSVKRLIKKLIK